MTVVNLTFLNMEFLLFQTKYNQFFDNLSNPQQNSEEKENHQSSATECRERSHFCYNRGQALLKIIRKIISLYTA